MKCLDENKDQLVENDFGQSHYRYPIEIEASIIVAYRRSEALFYASFKFANSLIPVDW